MRKVVAAMITVLGEDQEISIENLPVSGTLTKDFKSTFHFYGFSLTFVWTSIFYNGAF